MDFAKKNSVRKYIYIRIFLYIWERNSLPGLLNMFTHFRSSNFKILSFFIRQGKSSSVLCERPISVEMEINYPYLSIYVVNYPRNGLPQKYKSARIWAYGLHYVGLRPIILCSCHGCHMVGCRSVCICFTGHCMCHTVYLYSLYMLFNFLKLPTSGYRVVAVNVARATSTSQKRSELVGKLC